MSESPLPKRSSGKARRALILAAKLTLFAGLIAFALLKIDAQQTAALLASVPLTAFAIAYLAKLLGVFASALRWESLLAAVGASVPRAELFRLTCGGQALNLFLPSSLGGDVYRIYGVRKDAEGLIRSTGVVLWERFCGFLATAWLAAFAVSISEFKYREPLLTAATFSLTLFLTFIAWVVHHRRAARWATRLALRLGVKKAARAMLSVSRSVRTLPHGHRVLATILAYSIVMKLSVAGQYSALAWGLGSPLDPAALLVFLPLQMLVSALPISIAGVGPREANTVVYFTYLGMNETSAAALAVLILAWLYVSGLPFALALLVRPFRRVAA